MSPTQKQVIESLYELEHRFRLFERDCAGVRYWKLVRFSAYRKILLELGLGEELIQPDRKPSLLQDLRSWSRSIDWRRPRGDAVIYEFFRKSPVDGKVVDPYTRALDRELQLRGRTPVLIESDQLGHMGGFNPRRFSMKRQYLIKNRRAEALIRRFEAQWDPSAANEFLGELNRLWSVQIDLVKMIFHRTRMFAYTYYEDLGRLERIGPRDVFLLPSYNSEGRIQAARDLGIRTTELQHGTIYPMHFGYHFDQDQDIAYLPDRFFCFSRSWLEGVNYGKVDIQAVGDYTPFHQGIAAGEKTVDLVVVSQWILSRRLWAFVRDFAAARPDLSIVYKAHPRDAFHGEPHGLPNLHVERQESLYSLMGRSKQALGVYSTGVYEALLFNCRPILLDLPGIEMMESFCRVTGVRTVNSIQGLSEAMAEPWDNQTLDPSDWYPPSHWGNLLEAR